MGTAGFAEVEPLTGTHAKITLCREGRSNHRDVLSCDGKAKAGGLGFWDDACLKNRLLVLSGRSSDAISSDSAPHHAFVYRDMDAEVEVQKERAKVMKAVFPDTADFEQGDKKRWELKGTDAAARYRARKRQGIGVSSV